MGFFCKDSKGCKFYFSLIWNDSAKDPADWILKLKADQDLIGEVCANGAYQTFKSEAHPEPHVAI